MDNNKELELAWAAGFFDGEGCTCIWKGNTGFNNRRVQVQIHQSSADGTPEVLKRFLEAVEVGKIYGPYKFSNP